MLHGLEQIEHGIFFCQVLICIIRVRIVEIQLPFSEVLFRIWAILL